jgi:hypothetical protein
VDKTLALAQHILMLVQFTLVVKWAWAETSMQLPLLPLILVDKVSSKRLT